VNSYAYILL